MALQARPIQDRVFVEVDQQDSNITTGGIVVIEHNPAQKRTGRILASGPGYHDEKGRFIPNTLKPGDRVVLGSYAGTEITLEGKTFRVMREGDIAGLVDEDVDVISTPLPTRRDRRASHYR